MLVHGRAPASIGKRMSARRTLLIAQVALSTAGGVSAQVDKSPPAADACETAVQRSVERVRGRDVRQIQFVGAKRAMAPVSDVETGVSGEGRYRTGAGEVKRFTYSCLFNPRTGETSGVVFRDTVEQRPLDVAGAAVDPPAVSSTDACETAAANVLQRRHPRVSRIVFGSDTRVIGPAPNERTHIDGEGAAVRAPGMNAEPISYRCLFDPRTGKVDSIQVNE